MSNTPEVWPPKPGPPVAETSAEPSADAAPLATCPTCGRKLLTQTSMLCNWCGARIDDLQYQARAAEGRQARDQRERAALEATIQEEAQHGVLGRLKRLGKQKPAPRDPLA
jgi:DNA-directed RNA polymerase subunit RPC12/RpoP